MMLSLKRAEQDQVHVCLTIDGIRECELVKNTREAFEFEQQLKVRIAAKVQPVA